MGLQFPHLIHSFGIVSDFAKRIKQFLAITSPKSQAEREPKMACSPLTEGALNNNDSVVWHVGHSRSFPEAFGVKFGHVSPCENVGLVCGLCFPPPSLSLPPCPLPLLPATAIF